MKDYVTSVILGCDMIPRSSFRSVLSLKTTILDCISRAKANKFSIFESAIRSAEIDSLLFPPNQAPDCDFTRKLMKFKVCLFRILLMAYNSYTYLGTPTRTSTQQLETSLHVYSRANILSTTSKFKWSFTILFFSFGVDSR